MVGRLAREKRQDLIIRAAAKSQYADQIQLVFAGKGPLQKEYERLSQRIGLKHRPAFVYYNQEQLIDLLAQTDVYVHASDMESEAIACIEAFATGVVPVISNSELSATKSSFVAKVSSVGSISSPICSAVISFDSLLSLLLISPLFSLP